MTSWEKKLVNSTSVRKQYDPNVCRENKSVATSWLTLLDSINPYRLWLVAAIVWRSRVCAPLRFDVSPEKTRRQIGRCNLLWWSKRRSLTLTRSWNFC